jgi:hypothetical protein
MWKTMLSSIFVVPDLIHLYLFVSLCLQGEVEVYELQTGLGLLYLDYVLLPNCILTWYAEKIKRIVRNYTLNIFLCYHCMTSKSYQYFRLCICFIDVFVSQFDDSVSDSTV